MTPIKQCRDCGQTKPIAEFRKDSSCRDGYRNQCKDCFREYYRCWQEDNREHIRQYTRDWKAKNRERNRQLNLDSYYRHREEILGRRRKKRAENPEPYREERRIWAKEHPKLKRAAYLRYMAQKRGAEVSDFDAAEWEALLELYDHRCAYCGERSEDITQDHIVPLSEGSNHTLINIVPACRSCNSRKGARTPKEAGMAFAVYIENPRQKVEEYYDSGT